MPTRAPQTIPAPMLVAGPLNPYDWVSVNFDDFEGVQQSSIMRGQPAFAEAYQRRQIPGPGTLSQPAPWFYHSRPFSRGAGAYAPQFGVLNINPIGSGVPVPYKLPVIAGPGARYVYGAIWFDVQSIPTSMHIAPTISTEAVAQLLASGSVAAMYPTTG